MAWVKEVLTLDQGFIIIERHRKVIGGEVVVAGGGLYDYSVSRSSSPFPLEFGLWILDLGLGFGTCFWDLGFGLGLENIKEK